MMNWAAVASALALVLVEPILAVDVVGAGLVPRQGEFTVAVVPEHVGWVPYSSCRYCSLLCSFIPFGCDHSLTELSAGSSTSSALPSIKTPVLSFLSLPSMKTCEPAQIAWLYRGPGINVLLTITNSDVDQDVTTTSTAVLPTPTYTNPTDSGDVIRRRSLEIRADPVTKIITQGTLALDGSYVWSSANVSVGRYILQASFPNVSTVTTDSSPFSVTAGSDTSCLGGSNTSASSTGTGTGTSTRTPGTTSRDTGTTGTNSATSVPVVGATSVNKGAIAGGVVGGLAIVAAFIGLFLFLRYQSSSRRTPSATPVGKWGNLGSFDSGKGVAVGSSSKKNKAQIYNGRSLGLTGLTKGSGDSNSRAARSQRHNSRTDSLGPINTMSAGAPDETSDGGHTSSTSPFDEKYRNRSDSGHGDDMGMIPIGYASTPSPVPNNRTSGRHSSSSSANLYYAQNNNYSRPRSQSNKAGIQTLPESVSGSDVTLTSSLNHRRASSPTIPAGYVASDAFPAPLPPHPSRSSVSALSPGPAGSRRTPRKPVPTYNPQDPTLTHPSHSDPGLERDRFVSHELTHKDSFGSLAGRQIHYLIPDPPPPQRD